MQDLSEHARDVDLDGALARTYERHGELARARDRTRRLTLGGGVAAIVVLAVVAGGADRVSAVDKAHAEAAKVDFDGSQRRSDIGRLHFE